MPVLATGISNARQGKIRKKIRRITRALGSIRELDVTISLIDELARREAVPRLALEHVRAAVLREHARHAGTMAKRLEKIKIDRLDRRLVALAAGLEESTSHEWRNSLAARLVRRAKRLRVAIDRAGQMYEAERLHAVRIAAKKLRYAMELAAESGVRAARRPVLTVKRAQEALGRLHDLQVLQGFTAAAQAEPSDTPVPDNGLAILSRLLESECRHLHARYLKLVPSLQATIDLIRSDIVPQVVAPARRRRQLKIDSARARTPERPLAAGTQAT